jgi:SpoVK/Ycf46/Vps4 family AAA+-type ATPase
MVGLPTSESRELILRTLLSKEKVDQLDFKELATMTEGYSGSDLKVSSILILVLILPSQGN